MNKKRSETSVWIWPLVGAIALLGATAARFYRQTADGAHGADHTQASQPLVPTDESTATSAEIAAILAQLVETGWDPDAASAVVELNREFFALLIAEDPDQVRRIVGALKPLARRPGLMQLIQQRPETAGLLAATADPNKVAASLSKDQRYNAVSNIYARHGANAADVAAALERHGSLICHLIDEGMLGAESVFIFPRESIGAEAYDQWLSIAFESAMTDESKLASMFQLAMVQGGEIRRAMIDDEVFRERFASVAWPRLERLVDAGVFPLEMAALDVNLFRLLSRPQGERLVRRWGMLPLELLYGEQAYSPELHDILIETMLAGDNATLASLLEFGKEPLLAPLLGRRDVSPEVKASALARLHAAGGNYPEVLRRYSEMKSARALRNEVGPPPDGAITWLPLYYTVYEVPKKIVEGRNPTMMDAVIAVLDPVFLFMGPLGPDDAVKVVGQQSVKAAGRKTATTAAGNSIKTAARQQVTRRLGAQAAKLGTQESAPWLVSQMLRGTQRAVRGKMKSAITVDVTGPTRLLFKVTGVGRKSFRQLTRLEARLFMRPDRRVLIRLDKFIVGHPAGRFLADTAVAGLVETGIEIPEIENLAIGALRAANKFPDQAGAFRREYSAWQQNMSAWWLSQATGLLDEM